MSMFKLHHRPAHQRKSDVADISQPRTGFRNFKPLISRIKPFVSDTVAGVSYSFAVGMANEMLVAGLTFRQSLLSRLISIPANLLVSGPYGAFRNWIYKITETDADSSQVKKFFVDLGTFLVGQIPVPIIILTIAGASVRQTIVACATYVIISPFIGRTLGMWYDFVATKIFGLEPAGGKPREEAKSPE